LGSPEGELSLLLVNDERIAQINEAYLHHQGPTNVISFSMREGECSQVNPHLLGDVVISMDTCAAEATSAGLSIEDRLDQLIIHGILHLFGYDHIHDLKQARIMETKSDELLALIDSGAGSSPAPRTKDHRTTPRTSAGRPKKK